MPDDEWDEDESIPTPEEIEALKAALGKAVELLGSARCDVADPFLKRNWGIERRKVTDRYYELTENY